MERNLKVLLVEDEPAECRAIIRYVNSTDGVQLVGVTNSAERAVEHVKDSLPDAVILDIELHKGSGNGISFMQELRDSEIPAFPYILVTTNNLSSVTHDMAREVGADFIMSKYQDDYSAENVIEFLKSVKSVIQRKKRQNESFFEFLTPEEKLEEEKRIAKKINAEFDLVGISHRVMGRRYLAEAVQRVMVKIGPNVASEIAKKHGKTTASVERAMQTAIIAAWRSSCIEDLSKHYTAKVNPVRGIPTVMEFVHYYAEKMNNDYKI
ncbi:MAG: response regulator [Oscillospiraceae bacterium]|nr:response regulator [Oscillospiraceae bacterium]